MTNPMEFFMSVDVSLSDKLLEILYFVIGLIAIFVSIRNLYDKTNEIRFGTFIFWFLLGLMFVIGKWIPPMATGVLMVLMVLSPIFKQVKAGNEPSPTPEEMQNNYKKIGYKVFVPALSIGAFALIAALFTTISPIFGMGVGVVFGIILLMLFSKENTPKVFLNDGRRMLDIVGPLSMLPTLLAALGAVFTTAGVGDVISGLVTNIIPEGNVAFGIIVYAVGMALFTMVMGNAFAAITVMTVGIGAPFVLAYGADPVIIGSLALTCGYCGTLCTPMAANFNIVPVAVLEMKDDYGVIKNQVLIAAIMLVVQIIMMIVLS